MNILFVLLFAKSAPALEGFLNPAKAGCATRVLMETLKPDRYFKTGTFQGANYGVNDHYQALIEDRCFGRIADQFWTGLSGEFTDDQKMDRKPDLHEAAGQGRFAKYPPGWLWTRAKAAAKGDATLAMQLLGVCMHDDTAQDYYRMRTPENNRAMLDKRLADNDKVIRQSTEALETTNDPRERKRLEWLINASTDSNASTRKDIASGRIFKERALKCPGMSTAVYAPKSVDATLDVPESLKQQILSVQRPGETNPQLPAKAYHYMGGSLVGCELARCGLSPEEAGQLAWGLAKIYRVGTLTSRLRELIGERERLEAQLGVKHEAPEFQEKAMEIMVKDTPLEKMSAGQARYRLRDMDAATLYREWYMGGKFAIGTGFRIKGPEDLNALVSTPDGARAADCGHPGWGLERCRKARLAMSTWDADELWTKNQHQIGAQFGLKTCAGRSEKLKLESLCASPAGGKSEATR